VETISRGKLDVPHFTEKAKSERIVREAGFAHHTFVIAPFFYQNLLGVMAPQKQADGAAGWALPLDPEKRVIHMGDITELGPIVVGAFAQPELAGRGEHLPLVGDFLSFNEVIATLNRQGHKFSFKQVPRELLPGGSQAPKTSRRCLATSKLTPILARIRATQSRSRTRSPADTQRILPRGREQITRSKQQPDSTPPIGGIPSQSSEGQDSRRIARWRRVRSNGQLFGIYE
jgi:uncharacterized protein YbjT (DUF2867 family)